MVIEKESEIMEIPDANNIRTLTDFRNNMKKYINQLNKSKKPILLTQHGKSAAVLLHAEKYQEMQDQIEFMSRVAKGLDDYKQNRIHSVPDVFEAIDKITDTIENK
jgi:prevent-host-death family protein